MQLLQAQTFSIVSPGFERRAEILFNLGMGDIFNARVAGNIENPDILGSMEFTTKLAGAKVVLVMGHSACGAVAGAIADAKLGNLTQWLALTRLAPLNLC